MKGKNQSIKIKQSIHAPLEEVFAAFTNATAFTEWLCNVAQADARPGGRLYLWWQGGYYASGEYFQVKPNEKVVFSWHGRGEPGDTRVRISFVSLDGLVEVTLLHTGLGVDKVWAPTYKQFKKSWKSSLQNLKSVLESGQDLRWTRRPMLGVVDLEPLTPSLAEKLGLEFSGGLRVLGVLDGLGAQAAGLQAGDILVEVDKEKMADVAALHSLLNRRQPGDRVKIVYYRDSEYHKAKLVLSERPLPPIPETAEALAESMRQQCLELNSQMDAILDGVSDEMATFKPAPDAWNIKEVLAHLIANERDSQSWFTNIIDGYEGEAIFNPNLPARIRATVAAFPSLSDLLDEFKRSQAETIALLAGLPPEFVARKRSYWRIAYHILMRPYHNHEHHAQLRDILQAACAQPLPGSPSLPESEGQNLPTGKKKKSKPQPSAQFVAESDTDLS